MDAAVRENQLAHFVTLHHLEFDITLAALLSCFVVLSLHTTEPESKETLERVAQARAPDHSRGEPHEAQGKSIAASRESDGMSSLR